MIREDRELLAELAQLKRDTAFLGMCIMDGSASAAEQREYAGRLVAVGEWVRKRADGMGGIVASAGTVAAGEALENSALSLPEHTVEPSWSAS